MSKQLVLSLIFGILLFSSPAIAQKGKIRKAQNFMEALDYQAAIDVLLPLAENAADPEIATMLGDIFRKQNSYSKAAIWYGKAVALPEVKPAAYFYHGMMLLNTGKCREAQDQFDYFLSLQPLDPRQFQLRDACTFRQQLLQQDEDSPEVELLPFNSVLSDIGPAFYKNGLVFGSVRAPKQNTGKLDPFYDLYFVEMKDGKFDFTEPQSFSSRINSRVHEAIVTFNSDASMIYFTRNQGTDNEHSSATATGLEIVYAVSEDGVHWSDLQLLPFNSNKYSIAHPSLTPAGDMLFFSSDMPGGFGGKDIYVSTMGSNGYWGNPVNLGPLVNTEGDEMYPYYHPSGKLYFSSDGQVGLGGQDIFSTSPNKAGVWDNIRNVGAPINTEYDDYGIIVYEDESYGYYTSNRPGGKGKDDIYGFRKTEETPEEIPEEPLVTENEIPAGNKIVVHVQVIDAATGQRIENPQIRNCEVNLYRSVGTSSFQMNLFPGDCCEVSVSAPGFKESKLEVCGDPKLKSRAVTLQRITDPEIPAEEVAIEMPTSEPEIVPEKTVVKTPEKIEPEPQPEAKEEVAVAETPKEIIPEPEPEIVPEKTVVKTPEKIEPEPQPEAKEEVAVAETPKEIIPEPEPEVVPEKIEPEPQPEAKEEVAVAETPKEIIPEPEPEVVPEKTVVKAPEKIEAEPQPEAKEEVTVAETPKEIIPEPEPEVVPEKIEPEPQPEAKEEVAVAETPKEIIPEPEPEVVPEKTVVKASEKIEPEPQPEVREEVAVAETPKEIIPEPEPEVVPEKTIVKAPEKIEPEPQPEVKEEVAVAETPKEIIPEPEPEVVPEKTEDETESEQEVVMEEAVVRASRTPEKTAVKVPETKESEPEEAVAKANEQEEQAQEVTKEEAVVTASRETKSEVPAEEKSENAITVANEAPPENNNTPGVVEETTEIVRQTTRARKTTKYLIGTVYDPINSRPIPYATIHMLNSTCGVNLKIVSDASGHYRLPLVPNCCINIRVEKEGFQTYTALEAICTDKTGSIKGSTSLLLKPEDPKPKEVNSEAKMLLDRGAFKGFERSKNKRLGDGSLAFVLNVYYESARTSVKEESVPELKKLLKLLEENPTLIVEIGAHTDSRGSSTYNKDLSQRRAENVVKYLVSQGINERRLIPKGYGESQLINDCTDEKECEESEHQINRRTEFQILGTKGTD